MRKIAIALVAALAIICAPISIATAATTQVVTGTVTVNGNPLSGARVLLSSTATGSSANTTSNTTGVYSFNAAPGTYVASVVTDGTRFLTTYSGDTVRAPDAAAITVTATTGATVNIAANPGVRVITGKVIDSKGKPVKGATVDATAYHRWGIGIVQTASDGTYKLTGLPLSSIRIDVRAGSGLKTVYAHTKVAGSGTPGSVTQAPTVKLPKPVIGTATITARVKVSKKTRSALGNEISLTVQTLRGDWVTEAGVPASGKVKIKNVKSGTYRVVLTGTNLSKKIKVKKGKKVSAGTFTRVRGTKITGKAYTSTGKAAKRASVTVVDSFGTPLREAATDSKGRFTVRGAVSGKYNVHVMGNEESPDSPAKPLSFTVKAGKNRILTTPIKLVKSGMIKGRVVNTAGAGVEGAVVSAEARGTDHTGIAVTDDNGYYWIKALVPGKYQVSVVDPYTGGYLTAYYKPTKPRTPKVFKVKSGATVALANITLTMN